MTALSIMSHNPGESFHPARGSVDSKGRSACREANLRGARSEVRVQGSEVSLNS
jgi:hypothetical protein